MCIETASWLAVRYFKPRIGRMAFLLASVPFLLAGIALFFEFQREKPNSGPPKIFVADKLSGSVSYTHLDVYKRQGRDRSGEVFVIGCQDEVAIEVIDVQPRSHHLVLMVRDGTEKHKFLLGRDERHWFAAAAVSYTHLTGSWANVIDMPAQHRALADQVPL